MKDAFLTFSMKWQRQNADAMDEMVKKHGTVILRTRPEILTGALRRMRRRAPCSIRR